MISAQTIADSINPYESRLFTVLCRYPKFVHAEHCRHRSFSFSVSSSRAIPVSKNLEEVRSDELRAAPVWWGREQKGMESGEELDSLDKSFGMAYSGYPKTHKEITQEEWKDAAMFAANVAEELQRLGLHKSIVNRILEPFLHVNVLTTGTTDGWMNFFGLRLDRAAQPEMRALAEAIWREWNEHEPQRLEPGQWHLPFVDKETDDILFRFTLNTDGIAKYGEGKHLERKRRVSAARCARLSYMSFATQKRSTIEEDLALYDRLVSARHWGPLEHQATPDVFLQDAEGGIPNTLYFKNINQAGNLGPGWIQCRKQMQGENIAPLPKEYK